MLFAKTLLVAGVLAAVTLSSPPTAAGARSLREPTVDPNHAALERVVSNLVREGAPGALAVVRTRSGIRGAASGFASLRPRVPMRSPGPTMRPPFFDVVTPSEAFERMKKWLGRMPVSDVFFWDSIAGMPELMIDEHLGLISSQLIPLIRERWPA